MPQDYQDRQCYKCRKEKDIRIINFLIQSYTTDEVISKISVLKQADFDKVRKRIFETVF